MQKEIRFIVKEQHLTAIEIACERLGLTVAGFVRQAALEKAASMGVHAEQPRAD